MEEKKMKLPTLSAKDLDDLRLKEYEKSLYVAGDTFDVLTDLALFGKELQRHDPRAMIMIREFFVDARKGMDTIINYIDKLASEVKKQTPEK